LPLIFAFASNTQYRRNNRVNNPESEILSEAGNTASEQATLDLRWQTRE